MGVKLKELFLRFLLERVAPCFLAPIIIIYSLSWRIRVSGHPETIRRFVRGGEGVVYAHWHGDELVLVPFYAFKRLAVLSSLSKDGTIMANTLALLGYRVFRGSSTRGGARGLLGLIQAVQDGGQAALAVDGPRGPIYEVKPGIAELALRTERAVVCVRVNVNRVWFIPRAWNHSYVPKPFAKVEITFSPQILVKKPSIISRAAKEVAVEALSKEIQATLDRLPLACEEPLGPTIANFPGTETPVK